MDSKDHCEAEEAESDVRYADIAKVVCDRLAQNKRTRRNLPGDGRLRIDRQLPFLCVYRFPPDRDDMGTVKLVTTEAAYLFASGDATHLAGVSTLCRYIQTGMQEHFGTFLLIEIWSKQNNTGSLTFDIVSPDVESIPTSIETLQAALSEIRVEHQQAAVTIHTAKRVSPPGLEPLEMAFPDTAAGGCCVLGLAVAPVYRDPHTGIVFPMVLYSLRRQLAVAIRKTVAQFTGSGSASAGKDADRSRLPSYDSLGPSSFVRAARLVDQQLCEVSESFDFLLQVTPTNLKAARQQFHDSGCQNIPDFHYRPLPYRPSLLQRRLFNIEIERVEDPTLEYLFWDKQRETDLQLSALRDLGRSDFLYSSLQLYARADDALLQLARQILDRVPEIPEGTDATPSQQFTTTEFVARARDEIDFYHTQMHEFNATVEVSDKIAAGIMVSQGRLLVAENLALSDQRVEALLHHEIGTHLLTYFNGRCQPFRQLYAGLAGYEELQEGLAILAEYLVGGLNANRVRTLAGRVVAVDSVVQRNSFAQTFALLHHEYGFSWQRAFTTTLRAYRGGGLTKDVTYLRGLKELLEYLATGRDIEPLYVGKIGLHHVPSIQEMRRRNIIVPPRILPRFWDNDRVRERLVACRGMSVLTLLETDL